MKKRMKKTTGIAKELHFDLDIIKNTIRDSLDAKIYLGCDSVKVKKKRVKYATVIVIHFGAKSGCGRGAKVFGRIDYDTVVDAVQGRPNNRMLQEVNKIIEMYTLLEDVLVDRVDDVSIHLDINPKESAGSNVAYGAAKGMIQGIIGIEPDFKPTSFAASFAADRYCNA